MLRLFRIRLLCGLCCLGSVAGAAAQPEDIARFSGSMKAMAQLCDDDVALARLERKHEKAMARSGMTPDEYAAEFQRGYSQSQADYASLSAQEKQKACEQLQALSHQRRPQ